MFKARDSGDEKESKLEALGIDADIEKDGDDICDYKYSICHSNHSEIMNLKR